MLLILKSLKWGSEVGVICFRKAFKNDECFLFHVKSSFRSQDIKIFDLAFVVMYKKVNFKIYNVADWEIITLHILPNISISIDNVTITFGLSMECNIFLEKLYAKYDGEVEPRLFNKN